MEAFDKLPAEINHLVSSFSSIPVVGDLVSGLTQYTFWLIVSSIVLLIIMFAFAKRVAVVPRGRFANAVEYVIEYLENDVGVGILGKESWRRHLPFLGTLFMFIVVNNIIGIIPGKLDDVNPHHVLAGHILDQGFNGVPDDVAASQIQHLGVDGLDGQGFRGDHHGGIAQCRLEAVVFDVNQGTKGRDWGQIQLGFGNECQGPF